MSKEKNPFDIAVGERVKELRSEKKMSQMELAKRLADALHLDTYQHMTVNRIENGTRPVTLQEANALGKIFSEDFRHLFLFSDANNLDAYAWEQKIALRKVQDKTSEAVDELVNKIFNFLTWREELRSQEFMCRGSVNTFQARQIINTSDFWGILVETVKEYLLESASTTGFKEFDLASRQHITPSELQEALQNIEETTEEMFGVKKSEAFNQGVHPDYALPKEDTKGSA